MQNRDAGYPDFITADKKCFYVFNIVKKEFIQNIVDYCDKYCYTVFYINWTIFNEGGRTDAFDSQR